jgi:HSP20 family protein
MSMTIRDPWSLLDQWRQEMEQMRSGPETRDDTTSVVGSDWMPAVDIKEEDDRFVLYADIPGVSTDDIDITLENGILTIRGERRHEATESREGFKRMERQHGVFIRRFSLPESVNPEAVTASGNNGVLEVVLPKAAPALSRKIEVK